MFSFFGSGDGDRKHHYIFNFRQLTDPAMSKKITEVPKPSSRFMTKKIGSVLGFVTGISVCVKAGFFLFASVKRHTDYVGNACKTYWDDEIAREPIENDTFEKAAKRHRLTKEKLAKLRAYFLLKKRLLLFSFTAGLLCFGMGVGYENPYTVFMSGMAIVVIMLHLLQNSFRVWQLDKRKFHQMWEFMDDGGWVRSFHWFNGRTVNPNTIRILGFMTMGFAWCATITMAYAEAQGVGYYIDLAKNDQSMKMLGELFGTIGDLWTGEISPLAIVFLGYNSAVMCAGMLLLAYTASAGFLQTSQEGELFGKRFSTIWLPIRLTVGTVGILPMFGGWSGAQAIMFFGTALGIGFANTGWQVGSLAMVSHVGTEDTKATYTIQASDITAHKDILKEIIQSQMCVIGYNNESGHYNDRANGAQVETPYRAKLVEEGELKTNVSRRYFKWGGPGGDVPEFLCGKFEFPGNSTAGDDWEFEGKSPTGEITTSSAKSKSTFQSTDVITAHMDAIAAASINLLPYSREYFFNQTPFDEQALRKIGQDYSNSVAQALGKVAVQSGNTDFSKYMKTEGKSWISAGGVFFKMMQVNRDIVDATTSIPKHRPPEVHVSFFNAEYPGIRAGALRYEGFAKETMREHEGKDRGPGKNDDNFQALLGNTVGSLSGPIIMKGLLQSDEGFMFKIIKTGTVIFYTGVASVGAVLGAATAAGGTIFGIVLGNGILMFGITLIILPMFYIGLTMMVFIPMVPAIMWFSGVVTYFVIVVEAFAASPLWMITHFHGEGDGMGNKSAHGYMFLLNLVFRPILMIIGFLAAWLLLDILGDFLLQMMAVFWESFQAHPINFMATFFQWLAVLAALGTIANSLVQKLFGLVTYLPDQVITWVGGHAAKFGHSDDEGVRKTIVGMGTNIRQGAEGAFPKGKTSPPGGDHPEGGGKVNDTGRL